MGMLSCEKQRHVSTLRERGKGERGKKVQCMHAKTKRHRPPDPFTTPIPRHTTQEARA